MRSYRIELYGATREELDKLIEFLKANGERIFRNSSIHHAQDYPPGFWLSFGSASKEWSVTMSSDKIGTSISVGDFIKIFSLQGLQRIYDERVY